MENKKAHTQQNKSTADDGQKYPKRARIVQKQAKTIKNNFDVLSSKKSWPATGQLLWADDKKYFDSTTQVLKCTVEEYICCFRNILEVPE
jgi:hypothetical protein